jgi:hypothetical protein
MCHGNFVPIFTKSYNQSQAYILDSLLHEPSIHSIKPYILLKCIIDMKPWTRNMNPSWRTLLGIFSTYLLSERLWNQNGFIKSKFIMMVPFFITRHAQRLKAKPNVITLIMIKPIFLLFNMSPFEQYLNWVLPMTWISFNTTSKWHFCMVICLKKFSWDNFKVIANLRNNNLFVIFTKTFMGFVRLFIVWT